VLGLRSKSSLAAENLFLHKQLAFYQERKIEPRRLDNPTRLALVWLSRWFDWRNALTVVTPRTFIGWHRKGFRLTGAGNANPAGHGFRWTSNS
jgi:putative transposase